MSRYQLLPPLSADEYAALREDIRGAGVRVPIDVDEDGNILDGHHRKAIADELGVECPERVVRGLPEFAKVDYALSVNLARRHLDRDGRRDLVKKSLKRDPSLSDREHARRCGVSHPYVATVREALELTGQLETVTSRVGRDNRERPLPQTAGLAGPAPDAEQASVASGTAAEGADIPPSAADPDSSHAQGFSGEEGERAGTPTPPTDSPVGVLRKEGAGRSSRTTEEPAPSGCEKCGGPISGGQAGAGYTRCDDCDPEGDHFDDGDGCKGCKVLAETEQAYLPISIGETDFGLALECGECDSLAAHLTVGTGLPQILAAVREHARSCL